jgi:hypothetical protein
MQVTQFTSLPLNHPSDYLSSSGFPTSRQRMSALFMPQKNFQIK